MKKQNEMSQKLQNLALKLMKARQDGQPIDRKEVKEMWQLAKKARESQELSSEWFALDYMTLDQLIARYETPIAKDNDWIKLLLERHCTETSTFSQMLVHNHSVDVPPLCGSHHPDCWGYLYKDPFLRRWLSVPSHWINEPGSTWKDLKFSWIYASKPLPQVPITAGGFTGLTGRFVTDIQIDHEGPIGINLVSHATAIGYGGYVWIEPLDGRFSAQHNLYVSLNPSAVIDIGNHSIYHNYREIWAVRFDASKPDLHTMCGGSCFIPGVPASGGWAPSTLNVTFPLKGPTTIHVTEEIYYRVTLNEGALLCPIYPETLLSTMPGLFGDLAPLCWRVRVP